MLVNKKRIHQVNQAEVKRNSYVAYWMQSAQRLEYNQALGFAIEKANQLKQPLLIFFLVDLDYPEAEFGHFEFMFTGLKELQKKLKQADFNFYILSYHKPEQLKKILDDASLLVSEKSYLKNLQSWKKSIADLLTVSFYLIETNLICPIGEVSSKEEYAAYTIRKKINAVKAEFLQKYQLPELLNKTKVKTTAFNDLTIADLDQILREHDWHEQNSYSKFFKGGYQSARSRLDNFIDNKLTDYAEKRNQPELNYQSNLSPYLHFGQISALEVALAALDSNHDAADFLEELIVRRELAFNFVYYNQKYATSLKDILPDWAYQTLLDHRSDQRSYNYSLQELAAAETHDEYWNAAQQELLITGKMHNYLRMYWGKKILEWTSDPEEAYQTALKLNNTYSLDGRDANSYAGVAWCFGKHDRAWQEREIFGKVRYMNSNGLERKFDMQAYLDKINSFRER